jgi:S-adenosylmethionine decarboxylase
MIPDTGLEWILDARGCPAAELADLDAVRGCCQRIVNEMQLHVVGQPQWRKFDGPGGVTGLYLLSESHLSVHTFPEFGLVCLNVYCCRPRRSPDWEAVFREELGATAIVVRELTRGLCESTRDLRSAAVVRSGDQTTTQNPATTTAGGEPS